MAKIITDINQAKACLDAEGLVAIPTETVYGLAAKGNSTAALQKIYTTKGRPVNNPLILHFKDWEVAQGYILNPPKEAQLLAEHFWPGPLTLLLPKANTVPAIVTAGSNRVAVRAPKHPITQELLAILDYPLAAPSANPSGYISPTSPAHVQQQLGGKIPFIVDGGLCNSGIESTILGWENGQPIIYRKGVITAEQIGEVLGSIPQLKEKTTVLEAPGMLSSHYAPNTQTIVTTNIIAALALHPNKKTGLISFTKDYSHLSKDSIVLSPKGCLAEMAQKLYAAMHTLDAQNLDLIIIEKAPEKGIGKAINDRLMRSSST